MKLFHAPGTRSARVLWLLEELGADYELETMAATRAERATPDHMLRHPLGRVPVLEQDEGLLFESTALLLQLADQHLEAGMIGLLGSHRRGLVYQWSIFCMTELEPALGEMLRDPEPGRARFREVAAALESAVAADGFLAGDSFSVADVVCGGIFTVGRRVGLIDSAALAEFPRLAAYLAALDSRPAKQRAYGEAPSQHR